MARELIRKVNERKVTLTGRAAVRGFINYLKKPARHPAGGYEERKSTNREPRLPSGGQA